MSSKDWGVDLRDMLKSTENNISSIKNQLGNKYATKSLTNATQYHLTPEKDRARSSLFHSRTPRLISFPAQSMESPSLITSLQKRVEEQSKTISYLSETVQIQSTEIQNLKDNQNDFENQLRGRTGLTFDRKIESLQRELRSEIDSLRAMVNGHSLTKHNDSFVESGHHLSRDVKLQRRLIEDETDSVRREVDTLKNRIIKIESDVHTSLRDSHEVNRKFTNVQRDVSTVSDYHRQLKRIADRKDQELHYIKQQLQEISGIVSDMSHVSTTLKEKRHSKSFRKHKSSLPDESFCNDRDSYKNKKHSSSAKYLDDSLHTSFLSHSSELDLSIESLTILDGSGLSDNFSDDDILGEKELNGKNSISDNFTSSGKSYRSNQDVTGSKSNNISKNDKDLFGNTNGLDSDDDLTATSKSEFVDIDIFDDKNDLFDDKNDGNLFDERDDLLFVDDDNDELSSFDDDNNDFLDDDDIFKSSNTQYKRN